MRDGHEIPELGFGTWQVPAQDSRAVVVHALRAGYRHIDTASAYGNESGVGAAIASGGVAREDVFVATKLWNSDHGRAAALRAFDRSARRLGDDAPVDLYLIHWPVPSAGRYVETWEALVELRASGRVRSIGVSNFSVEHLTRIIEATGEVPAVNQVELHPRLQQHQLRAYHAEHGILTEAWSPLGQGDALRNPVIAAIAREHGRTPAQVVIRWHLEAGNVVIPKSVTPQRIEENFDVFGFRLREEDLAAIAGLDDGHRIGPDPDTFSVGA